MPECESEIEPGPGPTGVPWAVFFLAVLLLLPSIWSETSITGSDEYTLSLRTPMEMMDHGQWLTPWLDGEPRLRKPPLLYWAILANYQVFGIHLVGARIWGVLAGAGLCLSAVLLARQVTRSNGLLAGFLAMSTIGVALQGRQALLDLPLATLCAFGVLFWLRWALRPRLAPLLVSAACLGLALLTKGPAALLFFGAGAIPAWWLARRWPVAGKTSAVPDPSVIPVWAQVAIGALVVAAIFLPWPLAMKHLWGDRLAQILGDEFANRKAGALSSLSPFSALGGALGLVFPWTLLVLAAVITHASRRPRNPVTSWLLAWILISVLPFFFMKSFERYMLAVLPAQTVLCADWLETSGCTHRRRLFVMSVALLAALALALAAFVFWFRLGTVWPLINFALALATVGMGIRKGPSPVPIALAGLTLAVSLGFVYPAMGIGGIPAGLRVDAGGRQVVQFRSNQPSMLSMRLRTSVPRVMPETLGLARHNTPAEQIVFVEETHQPLFQRTLAERGLEAQDLGGFKTFFSKKAWLRFARRDAKWPDWKQAIRERSVEGLKSEVRYYLVRGRPAS